MAGVMLGFSHDRFVSCSFLPPPPTPRTNLTPIYRHKLTATYRHDWHGFVVDVFKDVCLETLRQPASVVCRYGWSCRTCVRMAGYGLDRGSHVILR